MKHRFTLSLLSVFVLGSLFISSSVFAAGTTTKSQTAKSATTPTTPTAQETLVGTVNIQKAQIISQVGNKFEISFEFSNREMLQTGVKYGVKLVSKTKTSQVLADEKVYDESVTLPENSTTKKQITYVAPDMLSGTYSIVLFASNSSGFSFGISFVKEVILKGSGTGFEIVTDSCYLKVEGDASNTHYALTKGVDISKDENLRLTCNTINHSADTLSLTPSFETRYHSAYGDVAETTGGDVIPISFAASKSENFSVLLPKGISPQVYNVNVKLSDGRTISNTISSKYVIRGMSATITNLSLDKDYYKNGDKAILSFLWTAPLSTDKFIRGDNSSAGASVLSLNTTITNAYNTKCAEPLNQQLVRSASGPILEIPVSITATCLDPHVSLVIKDASGKVLDSKDFIVKTTSIPQNGRPSSSTILIIVIALILIVIITMYMKKKNKGSAILPALILLIGLGFMPAHHASADQYIVGIYNDIEVISNLDYGLTYYQNDPFRATGTLTPLTATVNLVNMDVTAAGTMGPLLSTQALDTYPIFNYADVVGATANVGQYISDFRVGVFDDAEPLPPLYCPSDFAFSGVFRWGQVHYFGPAQHGPITVNVTLVGTSWPPSSTGGERTSVFTFPSNSNHSFNNGMDCYGNYGCEIEGTGGFDHGYVASINPAGSCPPPPAQVYYNNCFVADTLVQLADGTKKNIQDVQIGDVLKGEKTNNKVLGFHRPTLDGGKVYSFNGGRYFVTEEHPFKTTDGWKSINPDKTAKENIGITVTKLEIGDTLITDSGQVKLNTIDAKDEPSTTPLYNFLLNGDHTYYADGYLVHNKAECHDDGDPNNFQAFCGNNIPCIDYQGHAYAVTPYAGTCAIGCNVNGINRPFCFGAGGAYCPSAQGQC